MSLYHLPLKQYTRRPKTEDIVIHCAMTPSSMDIGASTIRGWHINERGWLDIGYHLVVRRNGVIELGRPLWAMGAGVAGWNALSIHICLVGGCDSLKREQNNFTPAQWTSLESLVATLLEAHPGDERVIGHRDYPGVDKYCPSFDVSTWWRTTNKEK